MQNAIPLIFPEVTSPNTPAEPEAQHSPKPTSQSKGLWFIKTQGTCLVCWLLCGNFWKEPWKGSSRSRSGFGRTPTVPFQKAQTAFLAHSCNDPTAYTGNYAGSYTEFQPCATLCFLAKPFSQETLAQHLNPVIFEIQPCITWVWSANKLLTIGPPQPWLACSATCFARVLRLNWWRPEAELWFPKDYFLLNSKPTFPEQNWSWVLSNSWQYS